MTPTYLDYAASAPLDPRVAEAMAAAAALPGNPSSIHSFGRVLRAEVDGARENVARLFGVGKNAVTFTSGATEANALAIEGAFRSVRKAHPDKPLRIVVSSFEHASVWETVQRLKLEHGVEVDVLPAVDGGYVRPEDVEAALTPDTFMVSVQWANNVLGTVQPIADIGVVLSRRRAERGAQGLPLLFHSDAVQAVFTQAVRPTEAGVDILTASAHKLSGPKGVGVLVRCSSMTLEPLFVGGGQEGGLRHGTENVAAIVGFGRAAALLSLERPSETRRLASLRQAFIGALRVAAPQAELLADGPTVVPSTIFVRIPSMSGDLLMLSLDAAGFAVSAGSACDAGTRKRSRTLTAAFDERRALHGGVRVSFGRFTTEEELVACARAIGAVAK